MIDLYRSDNLVVRCIPGSNRDRWVITFDNFGIGHGFDRQGFGEEFFRARDVSAIHVMGRSEDWYQYPDMADALATVREATAGSARVMTYGSSMGGYAAIRFADAVGAHAVLALSPQYSIDPAKPPFDDRWSQHAHAIVWLPEIDGKVRCEARPVVIFDPKSADGMHARRLAQDIEIQAIPLANTGHPVTTYLREVGLLESFVVAVLDDTFEAERARDAAWAARKTSIAYLNEMMRVQPPSRPRTAIGLARLACEIAPDDPNALSALAERLSLDGQHDQALALFERSLSSAGRLSSLLIPYANGLIAAGRPDEAHAIATEVLREMPNLAYLWAWYAHICWLNDAPREARSAIRTAISLNPTHVAYVAQTAIYGEETADVVPLKYRPKATWIRRGRIWARRRYLRIKIRRSRLELRSS